MVNALTHCATLLGKNFGREEIYTHTTLKTGTAFGCKYNYVAERNDKILYKFLSRMLFKKSPERHNADCMKWE